VIDVVELVFVVVTVTDVIEVDVLVAETVLVVVAVMVVCVEDVFVTVNVVDEIVTVELVDVAVVEVTQLNSRSCASNSKLTESAGVRANRSQYPVDARKVKNVQ
jgi:hypothetical protein